MTKRLSLRIALVALLILAWGVFAPTYAKEISQSRDLLSRSSPDIKLAKDGKLTDKRLDLSNSIESEKNSGLESMVGNQNNITSQPKVLAVADTSKPVIGSGQSAKSSINNLLSSLAWQSQINSSYTYEDMIGLNSSTSKVVNLIALVLALIGIYLISDSRHVIRIPYFRFNKIILPNLITKKELVLDSLLSKESEPIKK